jgi:hypothetical protein
LARNPKIGPALALVTAALAEDLALIYATAELAMLQPENGDSVKHVRENSLQGLADSCTELIRRMVIRADIHQDIEAMSVFADYVTNTRYVWPDMYARTVDRRVPWSPARRYGIRIARELVHHYTLNVGLVEGDGAPLLPPRVTLRVPPRAEKRPQEFTLGLAYATALCVSAIADIDNRPVGDRLDAYRAAAAKELLHEAV